MTKPNGVFPFPVLLYKNADGENHALSLLPFKAYHGAECMLLSFVVT